MLIASLVASLIALAFCCLGLLGFCLWLLKRQRLLAEQQRQRDAARDKRIKELSNRLDAYLEGNMRIGDELRERGDADDGALRRRVDVQRGHR